MKNGDAWRVESFGDDGSLVLARTSTGARVAVDGAYATANVELGYATTLHRAQGRTVDRAHCYITPRTSRELLYVAMTRGRDANLAYVDTGYDVDPATSHDGLSQTPSLEDVFRAILRNVGSSRSATDVRSSAFDRADSVATLLAEYTSIAQLCDSIDWAALVHNAISDSGLADDIVAATGFDALVSTMRRAQDRGVGRGVDLATTLELLVNVRELGSAADVATVLDYRLTRWLEASKSVGSENLIAGLFPETIGDYSPDVVSALDERRRAIETRCEVVIERAFEAGEAWIRELGAVPEGKAALAWRDVAVTVAAYRERWNIDDRRCALGHNPAASATQRAHFTRARAALDAAPWRTGSDELRPPSTLSRQGSYDPTSWSLATLNDQLHLARETYRRAEASLGIATLIAEIELRACGADVDDLERRRQFSPDSAVLDELLVLARDGYQRAEASSEVSALIEELELRTLRDEATAAEDAVDERRHQLDTALGHVVLVRSALSRDVDAVRSHLAWGDAVVADQARSTSPHDFARRRLEVEIRNLRKRISAATPESAAVRGVNRDAVSEEREQLQHSLAARTVDYQIVTGALEDGTQLARVVADVATRHRVDPKWLAVQKSALGAIEFEAAAQMAYETRGRPTNAMTTLDEPALAPEPTIADGFGIDLAL